MSDQKSQKVKPFRKKGNLKSKKQLRFRRKYPSAIELGSLASAFRGFTDAGIDQVMQLAQSEKDSRKPSLRKLSEVDSTEGASAENSNVPEEPVKTGSSKGKGDLSKDKKSKDVNTSNDTPKSKTKKLKIWERQYLRDIPRIVKWGESSSKQRISDKDTSRYVSIITSLVYRLSQAHATSVDIQKILEVIHGDTRVCQVFLSTHDNTIKWSSSDIDLSSFSLDKIQTRRIKKGLRILFPKCDWADLDDTSSGSDDTSSPETPDATNGQSYADAVSNGLNQQSEKIEEPSKTKPVTKESDSISDGVPSQKRKLDSQIGNLPLKKSKSGNNRTRRKKGRNKKGGKPRNPKKDLPSSSPSGAARDTGVNTPTKDEKSSKDCPADPKN